MDGDIEKVLIDVGPRIRATRRKRGLTLAELAELTTISQSTLSRLEGGKRRPTLELLLTLARAFDIQIDELVNAPVTGDPRVHLRPVTRHGMTYVPLSRRPGGIQTYKVIIPGTGRAAEPELNTHVGYEWIYVIDGRLRLLLGDRDMVLKSGEVAEFDGSVPHWLGSADGVSVEMLLLSGKQGERAHLRVRTR